MVFPGFSLILYLVICRRPLARLSLQYLSPYLVLARAARGPVVGAVVVDGAGEGGGRLEEESVLALLVGEGAVGALEEVVARQRVLVHLQRNAPFHAT